MKFSKNKPRKCSKRANSGLKITKNKSMNKNINCEQESIKLLEENGFYIVLGRNKTEIFKIIDDVCKIDRKIKFAGILIDNLEI